MNQPIANRGAKKQTSSIKSTFSHYLDHHKREAKDSFVRLSKAPVSTLMTVLVMAIALSLPLALGFLLNDARTAADGWDSEARLSIYLKDGLSSEQQRNALRKAQALDEVASVSLITPEVALEEFKESSGYGQALKLFDKNPLPPVLEVFPVNTVDTNAMTALRDQFAQWEDVELAEVDIAWVQRLQSILDLGQRLLYALGSALIIGGLLVVGNTIRLSIESRRDEVRVISLLGATRGFIRRPFIYLGVWCGLSAGLVTLGTVSALIYWLNEPVMQLARLYGSEFALSYPSFGIGIAVILGAGFLGWLGSWLAVGRHLRESEPR
jgi:cell division transport system permease protein